MDKTPARDTVAKAVDKDSKYGLFDFSKLLSLNHIFDKDIIADKALYSVLKSLISYKSDRKIFIVNTFERRNNPVFDKVKDAILAEAWECLKEAKGWIKDTITDF